MEDTQLDSQTSHALASSSRIKTYWNLFPRNHSIYRKLFSALRHVKLVTPSPKISPRRKNIQFWLVRKLIVHEKNLVVWTSNSDWTKMNFSHIIILFTKQWLSWESFLWHNLSVFKEKYTSKLVQGCVPIKGCWKIYVISIVRGIREETPLRQSVATYTLPLKCVLATKLASCINLSDTSSF